MVSTDLLEDFDYLIQQLPQLHHNLHNLIAPEKYRDLSKLIRLNISSPDYSNAEFELSLSRLFSAIKDPHTIVIPTLPILPIFFDWVSDGFYLFMVQQESKSFLGKKLKQVNQVPVDKFVSLVDSYLVYNNQEYRKMEVSKALRNPVLIGTLTGSPAESVDFVFSDNSKITVKSITRGTKVPKASLFSLKGNEWLDPKTNYSLTSNPDYLYLRYSSCHEDESYPLSRFYLDIDQVLKKLPPKIIVDFRENGGGDSRIFDPIIEKFEKYQSTNKIEFYGLINLRVFSSGILNSYNYKSILGATLVGQPTGQGISHYGDVKYLVLPHTQVKIQYSTKHFEQPGIPDTATLTPDIHIEPTISDLLEGNDIVLDYCIKASSS